MPDPGWVFLEEFASFSDVRNATTATGVTSAGRPVTVSFELVHPPGVSRWSVHCPGLKKDRGFNGSPQILNAAGAFVVMRMLFFTGRGRTRVIDYFVYRAGPGKPTLHLVPGPCPKVQSPKQVGVVPARGAGGHYNVVFPVQRLDPRFELEIFVFDSETRAWSSRLAEFSQDEETTYDAVVLHTPTKAVAAGGGSLAWIDLWRGALLCEWRRDDGQPVLRLIQWPVPPPRGVPIDIASPVELRDATMSDGAIRFVELRLRSSGYGGRCACTSYFAREEATDDEHGWTASVWKRELGSGYGWGIGFKADTYNVFADDSRSRLVRRMRDEGGIDLNKMVTAGPVLSLQDEDVVYMEAKSGTDDPRDATALMLVINAREERLEAADEIPLHRRFSTFCQCTFSRFLGTSLAFL
ncbi:unnamed protein product [Urochloa decumbens]|uniref:DUF1618 domain-containing protein n=1 Tax=Urochloa decumbens TaxID=240449 RepID=A0ABC8XSZ8_9POAL